MDQECFVETTIDVHRHGARIRQQERLLEASPMLPANKELIGEFINSCKVDARVGEASIVRLSYALRRIGELVDVPFKSMTERDINDLLARLMSMKSVKGKPYGAASIGHFRKTISKFWRWLYFDEYQGEAPPAIRRLRATTSRERKEPEVYTRTEIRSIIEAMSSVRNKAFFSCLYDLECRVGELLSRRIRHVQHTEQGDVQIHIDASKTSTSHWETLFESVPYFMTWFRLHPLRNNPNAPLWTMLKIDTMGRRRLEPLTYAAIRKVFLKTCKRLDIRPGRPNRMNMFRKSKATHDLADGVPVPYIESRGSWTPGSQALRHVYLAVIRKDKDNAYRRKYDMQARSAVDATPPPLKRCPRCEGVVEHNAQFCARCGLPAGTRQVANLDQVDLTKLIDPEMLSRLVKRYVTEEMAKQRMANKDQLSVHSVIPPAPVLAQPKNGHPRDVTRC